MDKNANPFLNPEWSGLQQQYIDALSSLTSGYTHDTGRNNNSRQPWNDALEHWRKSVEAFVPHEGKSLFDNLLNQTRAYYSIAGDFAGLLQDIAGADRDSEDWRGIMTAHLGRMKAQFDSIPPGGRPEGSFAPFFQSPLLDSWKKMVDMMSVVPEETIDAAAHDNIGKIFERLLSMPGLGPTREFQHKLTEATLLWKQYQAKLQEYQVLLAELGKLALDRLEQKIIGIADRNARITSLKQLYDLWVDANEEVFARFALNNDHSMLYGELVNTLMQYRLQLNQILDDIAGLMNLPNGAAMQTVYRRQQHMRQALRNLNETQQHMQDHCRQLQTELERLRGATEKTATRSRAADKPKKASRKSPRSVQ